MSSKNSQFSVSRVDSKTVEEIQKYFAGFRMYDNFVRIGSNGYFYPEYPDLEEQMLAAYNVSFRKSDVIVMSFPRSGTTWTQELVWLVVNDLDYETAKSKNLFERYNFLDYGWDHAEKCMHNVENSNEKDIALKMIRDGWGVKMLALMSDPRSIKTHIPLSLLPNVEDTAKVIYVARDPKDVAVSYYHLTRLLPRFNFTGNFKTFWYFFIRSMIHRSPYFDHVKEAWGRRSHPNFLFLFYEELSENLPKTIQTVCDFLGKKYNDDQISKLNEHLKYENFKKNPATNMEFLKKANYFIAREDSEFIRKGKTGEWRDYFDDEMTKQAEAWIEDNLRDTDLRFPQVSKKAQKN